MSRIIEFPPDGTMIPFDHEVEQRASAIVMVSLGALGALAQFTVVIATLRQGIDNLTVGTIFMLSLCCADFIFAILGATFAGSSLRQNGWATGRIGCVTQAFIGVCAICISIFSLKMLTLDRYLIVIKQRYITKMQAVLLMIALWIVTPLLCSYIFFTDGWTYIVGLGSSRFACAVAWWGKEPWAVFGISISYIVIAFGMLFVAFCYYAIVAFYIKRNRISRHIFSTKVDSKVIAKKANVNELDKNEIKLLVKALTITGTYFVCFFPYLVKLSVEIATSNPVPSSADSFCHIFLNLNPLASGTFLILFDGRTRQEVFEMLRIRELYQSFSFSKHTPQESGNVVPLPSKKSNLGNAILLKIMQKDEKATVLMGQGQGTVVAASSQY